MASIFKKAFTKPDPKTGKRVSRKTGNWYVKYRNEDERVVEVPGFPDKEATRQLAAKLEKEAALARAGVVDPYKAHTENRPVADHLKEFRGQLESKNRTRQHIDLTENRIRTIVDGCCFLVLADLNGDTVLKYLNLRREDGLSMSSINGYVRAIKGFGNWLVRSQRWRDNPFVNLSTHTEEDDRRHCRRALTPEEFSRLIETTRSGPVLRGLRGEERSVLYEMAAGTGLRAGELASLTPDDFDLESEHATVRVRAATAKNRRDDLLPIPERLRKPLKLLIGLKPGSAPIWEGTRTWAKAAAGMIRRDLKRAHIPLP